MFTLFAGLALLCLALVILGLLPRLVIPWFVCSIVDEIAWPLGFQTYVTAVGGPGRHRGRIGADRISFIRRAAGEPRPKRLKPISPALWMLALMLLPISLTACQTAPATGGSDTTITKVQNAAKAACAFLPTAETVAALIKVNDPRLATATALANAICNALDPATPAGIMTLFKAAPTVDGVVIRGERVGK